MYYSSLCTKLGQCDSFISIAMPVPVILQAELKIEGKISFLNQHKPCANPRLPVFPGLLAESGDHINFHYMCLLRT